MVDCSAKGEATFGRTRSQREHPDLDILKRWCVSFLMVQTDALHLHQKDPLAPFLNAVLSTGLDKCVGFSNVVGKSAAGQPSRLLRRIWLNCMKHRAIQRHTPSVERLFSNIGHSADSNGGLRGVSLLSHLHGGRTLMCPSSSARMHAEVSP